MKASERGPVIKQWWVEALGDRHASDARARAARLRRAGLVEALAEPAVHVLARRIGQRDGVRLANLVRTLAEVREDTTSPLARLLGTGKEPVLSHLRFQRLIRSQDEDLTRALRRALPMVERRCNVAKLGLDLLWWDDRTRARWCFEYFQSDSHEEETSA